MADLTQIGDDVRSGVTTDAILDGDRPGLWVTWIDWDSDFRRELQLGDLITAVDQDDLSAVLQPGHVDLGIGQWNEATFFRNKGVKHDQSIALTVLRGDATVTVHGKVHGSYLYYDASGNQSLAPGGPSNMAGDGFDDVWSLWYPRFRDKMSYVLMRAWRDRAFSNRYELQQHLNERPRIDYLLQHYAGPFAAAMQADWERTRQCLAGKLFVLGPSDLAYRALGDQRVAQARQAAAKAWDAIHVELAAQLTPPFPAPQPSDRAKVAGKLVELPRFVERDIIDGLGSAYIALGNSSDGYYFAALASPEVVRLFNVFHRYRGLVDPTAAKQFKLIARIIDQPPKMIVVNGQGTIGFMVQPIAALGGDDEVFVDLRQDAPPFAGEADLVTLAPAPHDDGSPASVIGALIQAVKLADRATWNSLFSPWRLTDDHRLDTSYSPSTADLDEYWEQSRQLITGPVFDARIDAVDRVQHVLRGDRATGVPDVEEVLVWIDLIGQFDGEYRSYVDVKVVRGWTLQRANGGPWQIATVQQL